jgi:hypothetical protein
MRAAMGSGVDKSWVGKALIVFALFGAKNRRTRRRNKLLTKISYCRLEDDPALLAYHDDGRILGFAYIDGEWREAHVADISTKGRTIGQERFEKLFPGIAIPNDRALSS